jgi:tetratricopeptide (TPR) repeat protein
MDFLENGKRQQALKLLDSCQRLIPGSGSLADDFFPALRHAGIDQQYKKWFEQSYQHVLASCKLFPKAHNTHNTAAWLASRAVLRLDDALDHAQIAVTLRPVQGAYLDTMAEVWFAKGDRKKAIEWSEKAIAASISHAQGTPRSEGRVLSNYNELNKQWDRFKDEPMPNDKR